RDIRIKISGQPQVARGVAYRIVAQICFKYRQVGGQVPAFQHPASQAANGMAVAKIVYPWALSPPTMRNPGLPEEPPEVLVDVSFGECFPTRGREKICSGIREQVEPFRIGAASIEKYGGQGDEPVLVEFPVQNRKDAGFKIHVPDFEIESL